MIDMSNAAHNIQTSLDNLTHINEVHNINAGLSDFNLTDIQVHDFVTGIDTVMTPLLHFLEGTPTRAIILNVVVRPNPSPIFDSSNHPQSFWSLCTITYLLFAQYATKKAIRTSSPSPKMSKRSIRLTLELLTLLLWLAGIACATLLASEYGAIIFADGAELKLAWTAIRPILAKALESLVAGEQVSRELDIVNDLFNVGAMAILAVASSAICGGVSLVSFFAACCISGKNKKMNNSNRGCAESGAVEYLMPMSADKAGSSVSGRSSLASWAVGTPMSQVSTGYSPAPQYERGPNGNG